MPVASAVDRLGTGAAYHSAMGFNPFRPQDKSPADVALVVGFAVLIGAVVLWAILG